MGIFFAISTCNDTTISVLLGYIEVEKEIKAMAKIKDGWHKVTEDYEVLTKDGIVTRIFTTPKGRLGVVKSEEVYPFVQEGSLTFNKIGKITLSALRNRLNRGTVSMVRKGE